MSDAPILAWIVVATSFAYVVAAGLLAVVRARRRRRHDQAVARFNAAIATYMVRGRTRTTRRRVDPRIQRRRALRLDRDR